MKYVVTAIVLSSSLLSGCVVAQSDHDKDSKTADPVQVEQKAAPGVVDRLHAIKFAGNDYVNGKDKPLAVSIGNGFTKAMINDEPAKIVRKNPNFYEITGQGYIVGVYLDETGVFSASWGKPHSKAHGGLNIVQGE